MSGAEVLVRKIFEFDAGVKVAVSGVEPAAGNPGTEMISAHVPVPSTSVAVQVFAVPFTVNPSVTVIVPVGTPLPVKG